MTWLAGVSGAFWTPEKIAELTRLCELGDSYAVIGKALGCSRNAALGKAHRLGLAERRTASDPRTHAARSVNRRVRALKTVTHYAKRAFKVEKPLPAPKPISVFDASFARPWLEREGGQCAYPIKGSGEGVWSCCAATGDVTTTYCAFHRKAMHATPATPAQRAAAAKMRAAKARLMKPSQKARAA